MGDVKLAGFQMLPTTSEHGTGEGACFVEIPGCPPSTQAIRDEAVILQAEIFPHLVPKSAKALRGNGHQEVAGGSTFC